MRAPGLFIVATAMVLSLGLSTEAWAKKPKRIATWAYVVGTLLSENDETKNDFLFRVASFMQAWTQKNNAEVCAHLAVNDDGQMGVKILTQKSQVMCITDETHVPAGMVALRDTIHSHVYVNKRDPRIRITRETFDAAREIGDYSLGRSYRDNIFVSAEIGPSKDDYAVGPGYVVANGRLLYQNGRKTDVDLGAVP